MTDAMVGVYRGLNWNDRAKMDNPKPSLTAKLEAALRAREIAV
jgi:hypothetical protein